MAETPGKDLFVHGTCVAISGRGVLLRGKPGSGKSDLALRFLSDYAQAGAALVSDDQVSLSCANGHVVASPPDTIAGKLEVRGVGVIDVSYVSDVRLVLIVDLCSGDPLERMPPDPLPRKEVLGVSLPAATLDAHEISATAKLKLLLTGEILPDSRCSCLRVTQQDDRVWRLAGVARCCGGIVPASQ